MAEPLIIPFRFPGIATVQVAFGTRLGGVSQPPFDQGNISYEVGDDPDHVVENRRKLLGQLGIARWAVLRQVHGTRIIFDPEPAGPETAETHEGDGLATSTPGLALAIKTADCQPVFLAHRSGTCIAALHVGWRGNASNFPGLGVRAFCDRFGVEPREVMAVRGPSLGPGSAEFVNFASDLGPDFEPWYDRETRTMDLWRLTRDQLEAAGIRPEHIFSIDLDTLTLPIFFSYRGSRRTGRQASVIWLS